MWSLSGNFMRLRKMNGNLLGIDLGTTGCKVAVYSPEGRVLGEGYVEYGFITKEEGVVEQDANEWWNLTKKTIKLALGKMRINGSRIKALSISSQGISFVPVDREGNPLYNVINWLDRRATKETEDILREFSPEYIFQVIGKRIAAAYTLPKILWLRNNKPDIFTHTHKFLMGQDYLLFKLTNQFLTDHTMAAGTLMYDVKNLAWSREIIERFNLPIEKLPHIKWAGTTVGNISSQAAKETGLSKNTLVVVGGQDQKCAALGTGLKERVVTVSLGTASAIMVISDNPVIDRGMRIPCFPYLLPNKWVLEGVIATAGGSFRWVKNVLRDSKADEWTYKELIQLAQLSPPGANGLFFFPHLSGASSPYWKDNQKGVLYGLTLSTLRADIVRSVLEGVAYEIKVNLDILEKLVGKLKEIKIFGGGAKSRLWGEIIANIANKDVSLFQIGEATVIGACLLAGVGSGIYQDFDEARKFLTSSHIIVKPDFDQVKIYEKLYRSYKNIEKKLM